MKWGAGLAGLLCIAVESAAAPARVWLEPFGIGVERLDSTWDASGLDQRTAARMHAGIGVEVGRGFTVAAGLGCASGTTGFGLLAGPSARLVRTDATVELRARAPIAVQGWRMQAVLGGGRLRIAYRPDAVVLDTSGGAIAVALAPVHAWTRHVAAELLHGVGDGEIVLRAGWRWYGLDVATPAGNERRDLRDLQCGLAVRIRAGH
jgi:hypothetical protein